MSDNTQKPYICITTFGIPGKDQVTDVEANRTIYNHLNHTYEASTTEDKTWFNRQTTLKIHISGTHVIFYGVGYNGWQHLKTISLQQYYNDVINNVQPPSAPQKPVLTAVQRNALIRGMIKDIDTIRYSATIDSIEKDNMLVIISDTLKAIHDN